LKQPENGGECFCALNSATEFEEAVPPPFLRKIFLSKRFKIIRLPSLHGLAGVSGTADALLFSRKRFWYVLPFAASPEQRERKV
jgi:hypothetical protein